MNSFFLIEIREIKKLLQAEPILKKKNIFQLT